MESVRNIFGKLTPEMGMEYSLEDLDDVIICWELSEYFGNIEKSNVINKENECFMPIIFKALTNSYNYKGKDQNFMNKLNEHDLKKAKWWLELIGMERYFVRDIHRRIKNNKLN